MTNFNLNTEPTIDDNFDLPLNLNLPPSIPLTHASSSSSNNFSQPPPSIPSAHASSSFLQQFFNPELRNRAQFTNGVVPLKYEEVLIEPNELVMMPTPRARHIDLNVPVLPDQSELLENSVINVEGVENLEDPPEIVANVEEVPNQPVLEGAQIADDHDTIVGPDGRNHNFRHNKYGPYTCPRAGCGRVFATSQHFANHTRSHYSHESPEQRRRRRMARRRRRGDHNETAEESSSTGGSRGSIPQWAWS